MHNVHSENLIGATGLTKLIELQRVSLQYMYIIEELLCGHDDGIFFYE